VQHLLISLTLHSQTLHLAFTHIFLFMPTAHAAPALFAFASFAEAASCIRTYIFIHAHRTCSTCSFRCHFIRRSCTLPTLTYSLLALASLGHLFIFAPAFKLIYPIRHLFNASALLALLGGDYGAKIKRCSFAARYSHAIPKRLLQQPTHIAWGMLITFKISAKPTPPTPRPHRSLIVGGGLSYTHAQ
jgi:hypothetical protein